MSRYMVRDIACFVLLAGAAFAQEARLERRRHGP